MQFSRLGSRKDTLLGWMACFSGLGSRKPAFQTTRHHTFSRPEWWKPSPGPRSELFRTEVMKTPPQARQHAIFKTRLPKRHLFRVDGLFFGTGVTKTSLPNHPPPHLFKTQVMKTIPRSKLFRTRVMKTPPQVRQHAIFKTWLPKRFLLRVDGLFFETGVTKTSSPNHPPPLLSKTRVMKTIHPQVQDPSFTSPYFRDSIPPNHPPPLVFKTWVMKTIHPQVQDPSFSGLKSWKHLPKWGNMPFSRLDSRKDTLLGWMACFSGLESRKPPFQTTHPPTFSRPEPWKPYIPNFSRLKSWKHLAK